MFNSSFMKITALSVSFILISLTCQSQETITLSGGIVIADAIDYSGYIDEEYHTNGNGFRITGTYEAGPLESKKFVHGISSSYIYSSTSVTVNGQETGISVRTLPFCYAPKYLVGSEKLMAFARAEVGMQFTRIKVGGNIDESDNDFGFYGGIGCGGMAYVSEKVFFNLEYELAFMSNTYYANGYINSLQLGLGVDF
jgi:hypothetical protein